MSDRLLKELATEDHRGFENFTGVPTHVFILQGTATEMLANHLAMAGNACGCLATT